MKRLIKNRKNSLRNILFYFLILIFVQVLSYKTGVRGNQITYAMNWEDIYPLLLEIMIYSLFMSLILLLYLNSLKKIKR